MTITVKEPYEVPGSESILTEDALAFIEELHAELRGTSVQVTVVFPGAVATSITQNSDVHVPAVAGANDNAANQKVLTPAEAAEIIIAQGIEKGAYRVLVPERAMTTIADKMSGLLTRAG